MADGEVTDQHCQRLARKVSKQAIEKIAIDYLGFNDETIKNLEQDNPNNAEKFNREIFQIWRNKIPRNHQKQVKT